METTAEEIVREAAELEARERKLARKGLDAGSAEERMPFSMDPVARYQRAAASSRIMLQVAGLASLGALPLGALTWAATPLFGVFLVGLVPLALLAGLAGTLSWLVACAHLALDESPQRMIEVVLLDAPEARGSSRQLLAMTTLAVITLSLGIVLAL